MRSDQNSAAQNAVICPVPRSKVSNRTESQTRSGSYRHEIQEGMLMFTSLRLATVSVHAPQQRYHTITTALASQCPVVPVLLRVAELLLHFRLLVDTTLPQCAPPAGRAL